MTPLQVVNAYVEQDHVTLLTRLPDGALGRTRARAEYCFFLRAPDLTAHDMRWDGGREAQ